MRAECMHACMHEGFMGEVEDGLRLDECTVL